jgi:hypothetical protein
MTTMYESARFDCPWPVEDADEDGKFTADCGALARTVGTGWTCTEGHGDCDESYLIEEPVQNFRERWTERRYAQA